MLQRHQPNMETSLMVTRQVKKGSVEFRGRQLPGWLIGVDLAPPADRDQRFLKSPDLPALFLRITRKGAMSWVFKYGRSATIGSWEAWSYPDALGLAREWRRQLDVDPRFDPLADRDSRRTAPAVDPDLIEEWRKDIDSKNPPKIRPSSRTEYETIIKQWIVPELGKKLVVDVERADIEKLHRKITEFGTAVRANRTVALTSRIFTVAVNLKWRADNPASKIERNHEEARYVTLTGAELERLLAALPQCRSRQGARAIELILLTGCRRNEILRLKWPQVDLDRGTMTLPPRSTKQKRMHHVPLNTPARQILVEIRAEADAWEKKYGRPLSPSQWVFPARGKIDTPILEVKQAWASICRRAGIEGLHLHDCRHLFGSFLASSGTSLYIVGRLLGHSRPTTTQRYAHLVEDPLREQTERWGAAITAHKAGKSAEVVAHPKAKGAG
jgi:integrase